MQLKFYRSNCSPPPPFAGWDWHSDPPSGTIRQSFTSNYYSHLSQGRNQCLDVVRGPIRHMQLKFYRSNCSATTMCCGGIGTSDPPTGTMTRLPQLPHTYPRDASSVADVVRGQCSTCSSNSTVPVFRHHHHVLRWDWHFRSTLWYHKTRLSHPNYPPIPGTQPVSQTWFRANSAHQLKFYRSNCSHHHHVLRWDWHFRSTHWYHKTRPSHQTTHTYPGTQPVLQRWLKFGTCSSNSTVPIVPPPPPCAAVGLALIPPGTIRQELSHPTTHIPGTQPVSQTWFGANSAHAAQILPFHLFPPPPCGGIGISDPHLWYHKTRLSHPNYPHLSGTQPVLQRWFGGQFGTCSSLPFQLFRHHHVLWVGLALQIHPLVP
jgi:hypothetical protein